LEGEDGVGVIGEGFVLYSVSGLLVMWLSQALDEIEIYAETYHNPFAREVFQGNFWRRCHCCENDRMVQLLGGVALS